MIDELSTEHVARRYVWDAVDNWGQTEEEATAEFYVWLRAVRNGVDR